MLLAVDPLLDLARDDEERFLLIGVLVEIMALAGKQPRFEAISWPRPTTSSRRSRVSTSRNPSTTAPFRAPVMRARTLAGCSRIAAAACSPERRASGSV